MSATVNSQTDLDDLAKTDFEKVMLERFCEPQNEAILDVSLQQDLRARIIQGVQLNLDQFNRAYNQTRDPRAIFNHAYEKVTEAILWKTLNPKNSFKHRIWLATLDDAFAGYYFRALDAYDAQPAVNDQPELKIWADVFDLIGARDPKPGLIPKVTVMEALILPLVVHTVHDLPLAVGEVALEEAQFLINRADDLPDHTAIGTAQLNGFNSKKLETIRRHRRGGEFLRNIQTYCTDFYMINDLLRGSDDPDQPNNEYSVINRIQAIIHPYSPVLLPWLDHFFGRNDEIITHLALEALRGMAWYNAMRLLEAETAAECDLIKADIAERTRLYINYLYRPDSRKAQVLLQLMRLVSSFFRTWPAENGSPALTAATSS